MPECVIDCVDSDSTLFQPVIANFQNGHILSDQVDKLQCAAFANKKTNDKMIAVATEKMAYSGVDNSNNELCYTLLTIRNKRTNKVRIVPVSSISLKAHLPMMNASLDSTLSLNKSSVQELNKQFGSKRTKRRTEQMERMRMNVSNVEKELEQTVADIKVNVEDLVTPTADENAKFYRPPINRNAANVDQVYDLKTIIKQEELDALSEMATELIEKEEIEEDKFAPFVLENINLFKKSNPVDKLKKVELLLYMDAIFKFFKMPIKLIGRKAIAIEPYPEIISNKVVKEFTVLTDNSRARPLSMRDKSTCYCIVLALIIMDYKLDLEPLSKSLGVGVKKLCDVSRILGAQPLGGKSKNWICLKLPIPAQTVYTGKRKR